MAVSPSLLYAGYKKFQLKFYLFLMSLFVSDIVNLPYFAILVIHFHLVTSERTHYALAIVELM